MAAEFAYLDDKYYVRTSFLCRYLQHGISSVVRSHSEMIRQHIQGNMRQPKHGRIYVRPRGRIHIASAPGEAPAVDTGNLINSLKIAYDRGGNRYGLFGKVGTWDTEYAEFLEGGTSRIAPRPFAGPAYDAIRDRFVASIQHMVRETFS